MRMLPDRYANPKPAAIKQNVSQIVHVSAPLKGLNLSSKLTTGDPLTAPILTNFNVENDRITVRAGYRKLAQVADGAVPIRHLVPWYGATPRQLAAANGKLFNAADGTLVKDGFASNDWHWTAFSNLGVADFTVMVNGISGVWSWDGTLVAGGVIKETVTAPAAETWINPNTFNIVLSHMNRLWFADKTNLAVYYLPLQQKAGEVKLLPLNALFRRGGTIRAMFTWTLEGGTGLNDQLVIFSSNGEAVIYSGTDPDTDFQLVGIFRFDSPMSKHSVVNYGGELYVLISTGVVPMSTMLRAESEQLGVVDQSVWEHFAHHATYYRDREGWQLIVNPSISRLIANLPHGSLNDYHQLCRHMTRPVWSQWEDVPAHCWSWINSTLYFGDDSGNIYEMHPSILNDDGDPITVDVQMAWSQFKTPALKHFKMLKTYTITDGRLQPAMDVKVDYDLSPPLNVPDVTVAEPGAIWDVATWDEDYWATGAHPVSLWNGVGALGRVGAPRLTARIFNCEFSITGWDVIYEPGSAV